MTDDDLPLPARIAAGALVVVSLVVSGVVTWVCFTGGTIPLVGIEVDGSFGLGIVALFVVDPLIMLVGTWIAAGLATLVTAVSGVRD